MLQIANFTIVHAKINLYAFLFKVCVDLLCLCVALYLCIHVASPAFPPLPPPQKKKKKNMHRLLWQQNPAVLKRFLSKKKSRQIVERCAHIARSRGILLIHSTSRIETLHTIVKFAFFGRGFNFNEITCFSYIAGASANIHAFQEFLILVLCTIFFLSHWVLSRITVIQTVPSDETQLNLLQ